MDRYKDVLSLLISTQGSTYLTQVQCFAGDTRLLLVPFLVLLVYFTPVVFDFFVAKRTTKVPEKFRYAKRVLVIKVNVNAACKHFLLLFNVLTQFFGD